MKKLFFAVVAFAAISFATVSCDKKQEPAAPAADSTQVDTTVVEEDTTTMVEDTAAVEEVTDEAVAE